MFPHGDIYRLLRNVHFRAYLSARLEHVACVVAVWWGCLTFIAPSSSVSIRQSVSQSLHPIIQAQPPPSVSGLLLNR